MTNTLPLAAGLPAWASKASFTSTAPGANGDFRCVPAGSAVLLRYVKT
jgi:hypothetical protein